jgi:hypothetical protein
MPVTTRSQAAKNIHITNNVQTGPNNPPTPCPFDEKRIKALLDGMGRRMERKLDVVERRLEDKLEGLSTQLFCTKSDVMTNTGRVAEDKMFNYMCLLFLYTLLVIFLFNAFDIHIENVRDQILDLTHYVMNDMSIGPIFPVFNNRYEDLTSHYYNIYANSSYVNETVVSFMEKVLDRALNDTADCEFSIIQETVYA